MSNALAIAATTTALQNLLLARMPVLDGDLGDLQVTVQPLDQARTGVTQAQLNIFLYQVLPNAAWRNLDTPRQVRPGESAMPPLALNLHYLITAYGRGQNDTSVTNHRVLGGAMSVLHDHPLLGREELAIALPASEVAEQFERLRITPLPIGVEEISKLWTVFQTQYRVSAAYEVTVLLIDSRHPVRAPPPVLSRGVASAAVPAAVLDEARAPFGHQAARLGEDVLLLGSQLLGPHPTLRFSSSRLAQPIELTPLPGGSAEALTVHLPDLAEDPNALARWAPGLYTCVLAMHPPGSPASLSGPVAFALAPRITVAPLAAAAGEVTLSVSCSPRVAAHQRVLLIFGERQAQPTGISTPADVALPSTIDFVLPDVAPGHYLVRLRVDGVDSIPVLYSGTPAAPAFDPAQRVSVT
ncbi:MAG: DUF4255 domain-containing protein [Pseudomonadota bacterium]